MGILHQGSALDLPVNADEDLTFGTGGDLGDLLGELVWDLSAVAAERAVGAVIAEQAGQPWDLATIILDLTGVKDGLQGNLGMG